MAALSPLEAPTAAEPRYAVLPPAPSTLMPPAAPPIVVPPPVVPEREPPPTVIVVPRSVVYDRVPPLLGSWLAELRVPADVLRAPAEVLRPPAPDCGVFKKFPRSLLLGRSNADREPADRLPALPPRFPADGRALPPRLPADGRALPPRLPIEGRDPVDGREPTFPAEGRDPIEGDGREPMEGEGRGAARLIEGLGRDMPPPMPPPPIRAPPPPPPRPPPPPPRPPRANSSVAENKVKAMTTSVNACFLITASLSEM